MNNNSPKLTAKMVTEALDMLRKKEYEHKGNVFILTESQYSALFGRLLAIELSLDNFWVKITDRLPTEADAGYEGVVLASQKSYDIFYDCKIIALQWEFVAKHPDDYDYWSPIRLFPKEQAEE